MPIRILHVVEAFGVGGGVENGIANLIDRMNPHRYEHVLCGVFRVGPQTERYPVERVPIRCLDQNSAHFRSQILPLKRLIREVKPNIVHSRNWGALEAVFAARLAGRCKAIHSEHGLEVNVAAEPRRRRWFRRSAYTAAHRVFCVSSGLRDDLVATTGFPRRKLRVIHNGVDTNRFQPSVQARCEFRVELGIEKSTFCIGCIGRLNKIKDYPTLFRALELFTARCGGSWQLVLAGEGPERGALEQMAAASTALRNRVRFLGPCRHVPELLNAFDVYVLPSIFEGISNSLLEAMASGTAAVATATGGNPEVIEDRQSGLLFPATDFHVLAERIEMLFQDTGLRQNLARQARCRIQSEFSLGAMVGTYERMYQELAGGRVQ